ncbi:triacylglycerol lipase 2-like [Rutidosis leptorrhynchoides]|uniref:triacylglycerol lipase 2-like n=1 Tax=Rutidosis leptorrhynchoides TaxID=125765 RepID=UPI003A99339E
MDRMHKEQVTPNATCGYVFSEYVDRGFYNTATQTLQVMSIQIMSSEQDIGENLQFFEGEFKYAEDLEAKFRVLDLFKDSNENVAVALLNLRWRAIMGNSISWSIDQSQSALGYKQIDKEHTNTIMAYTRTTAFILLVILCLFSVSRAVRNLNSFNEQRDSVDDVGICSLLIEKQGYTCEEHTVTTKDGYILSMQRIPAGRGGKKADKPPVLLQHGLFMDGATWVLYSPDESLGFVLADNGFDVWISNTRGTKYSRSHTSLSPNDPAFWEWSWDELASFDLPALIQYVHDQTGRNLHYVGHSLGTLVAFSAFSKNQTINLLRSAALLSPIVYLGQVSSTVARAGANTFLGEEAYWMGLHEFAPKGQAAANFLSGICNMPYSDCTNLMTSFTGPNCCLNSSMTDNFLKYEPQSTSTKNLIHLSQMVRSGIIAMYDYENAYINQMHYNQPVPPFYDMRSIPKDFPMYLSYGGLDELSDVADVNTLLYVLKDHDTDKLVVQFRKEYAHADFIFGVNAKDVIYDPVMAFFKLH